MKQGTGIISKGDTYLLASAMVHINNQGRETQVLYPCLGRRNGKTPKAF